LPHLSEIVKQNMGDNKVVKVDARGHGYSHEGVVTRECYVNVEPVYNLLV